MPQPADKRLVTEAALPESVQDIVGAMLLSGGSLTIAYNDATGKVTLTATGGAGTDAEVVRDTIGAAIVGAQGVTVAINDAADTITLGISGLTISQVTGLQTALNGKVIGLGGVKAVRYAATLPAWTPADEGTIMHTSNA